ncbi:MAG TPA: cytidine deaminase [Longimicrobiales bacterium]|nr:cytidine deaminase [Longimicrobiales bacterium]
MERLSYDDLDPADRELVDAARAACDTAYAPYSGVHVGAALRTPGGRVIAGSNVENAAYGSTICAERMAVGRANAEGDRAFTAVAVAARGARLPADQVVTPCGSCRQVLHEMAAVSGTRTRVLMTTPGTDRITIGTLDDLLPLPFGPLPR